MRELQIVKYKTSVVSNNLLYMWQKEKEKVKVSIKVELFVWKHFWNKW